MLDGLPVQLIGLAELRRNQAAAGRPKDKADCRQLPTSAQSPGVAAAARRKGRRPR